VAVDCNRALELISAALDGELSDLESDALGAHLCGCVECSHRADQMAGLHRLVRLRAAESVPDLSERILATANPPHPGHGEWIRYSLLTVALTQFVLAMPSLFGTAPGATVHVDRHLGSLAVAFALGLMYAAWRPVRAFGLLPLAGALAASITVTSILDVAQGRVHALGEAHHVLDVVGLVLLWALAGAPRPHSRWRSPVREERSVRSRRAARAAVRRPEPQELSDAS
jgi:predicted anti-sigma-YlaC factor YlaD